MSDLILSWAERFDLGSLYALHYWLEIPWRCKIGHTKPVYKASFIDGFYLDEQWYECGRCGHFKGYA